MTIQVVQIQSPTMMSYVNLSYTQYFEGTEQIILNTFTYDTHYNHYQSNSVTHTAKEPIKVMLESISYELSDGEAIVRSIGILGFRKDGKVRARGQWWYNHSPQYKDVLPQIPDSYHNHARTFFDETLKKLSDELLEARQKGLQVK